MWTVVSGLPFLGESRSDLGGEGGALTKADEWEEAAPFLRLRGSKGVIVLWLDVRNNYFVTLALASKLAHYVVRENNPVLVRYGTVRRSSGGSGNRPATKGFTCIECSNK